MTRKPSTTSPIEIGKLLEETRKALGWSQTELARRAGLPPNSVSRLESGERKNPTMETILTLDAPIQAEAIRLHLEAVDGFLASQLAKDMQITKEEETRLRECRWYPFDQKPTLSAWVDFLRALRGLKKNNQTLGDMIANSDNKKK